MRARTYRHNFAHALTNNAVWEHVSHVVYPPLCQFLVGSFLTPRGAMYIFSELLCSSFTNTLLHNMLLRYFRFYTGHHAVISNSITRPPLVIQTVLETERKLTRTKRLDLLENIL